MMHYVGDDISDVIEWFLDSENRTDVDEDNEGQVIIYTGVWRHSDGKYYTSPEEK